MVCTKCKEDKDTENFWKDYRREGLPSFYQQPCKDCRNAQKRLKRKIDFAENILHNSKVSYHYIRRRSNLKPEDVSKDFIELWKENIFLKREAKRVGSPFLKDNFIFCPSCEFVLSLPKQCTVEELLSILLEFNDQHHVCKNS